MIVEWLLGLVSGVGEVTASWFDWEGDAPQSVVDGILTLAEPVSTLGAWVPLTMVFSCLGISMSVWLFCFGIKTARAVAAHIPQFGGAG